MILALDGWTVVVDSFYAAAVNLSRMIPIMPLILIGSDRLVITSLIVCF